MAHFDGRVGSTREEIGALVVETLKELRAFSRSLAKDRVWADDLVQEAIVRALTSAHLFQPGTNFKAWMFTIIRNAFYSEGRQNSRMVCVPEHEDLVIEQRQDDMLEMADFKRAFWQLSPDHREILMLIGPSGLSYEEVALICGCAVGTVKSRTSRARQELSRILASHTTNISRRETIPASDLLGVQAIELPDWLGVDDFARAR